MSCICIFNSHRYIWQIKCFSRNLTEFYVGREESKLPRKIMNSHNAVISLFNMFVLKVNQWQRLTPSFYKKFIAFTPRK